MCRFVKFTESKKRAFLEALRSGARRGAAAESVGVTRQCVAYHAKDDPDFDAAIIQAEADACELVEDALFQKAKKGDVASMIFYLCNRAKERWRNPMQRIEQTGRDGGALEVSFLSAEERKARIDDLIRKRGSGASRAVAGGTES